MPMVTKFDRILTYLEGFQPIKLSDTLSRDLVRSSGKLNPLYHH